MFDFSSLGRVLLVAGIVIALVGVVLIAAGKLPLPGRLPGDLLFRGKNFSVYVPLTTSILVSVVVTLILWFLNRR